MIKRHIRKAINTWLNWKAARALSAIPGHAENRSVLAKARKAHDKAQPVINSQRARVLLALNGHSPVIRKKDGTELWRIIA